MKTKGDVISEREVIERITAAVRNIVESDVDGTIKLHNFVCKGEVAVFESEGGELLNTEGKVVTEPELAWAYIFTKSEEGS